MTEETFIAECRLRNIRAELIGDNAFDGKIWHLTKTASATYWVSPQLVEDVHPTIHLPSLVDDRLTNYLRQTVDPDGQALRAALAEWRHDLQRRRIPWSLTPAEKTLYDLSGGRR